MICYEFAVPFLKLCTILGSFACRCLAFGCKIAGILCPNAWTNVRSTHKHWYSKFGKMASLKVKEAA